MQNTLLCVCVFSGWNAFASIPLCRKWKIVLSPRRRVLFDEYIKVPKMFIIQMVFFFCINCIYGRDQCGIPVLVSFLNNLENGHVNTL